MSPLTKLDIFMRAESPDSVPTDSAAAMVVLGSPEGVSVNLFEANTTEMLDMLAAAFATVMRRLPEEGRAKIADGLRDFALEAARRPQELH